jgi:rubrerythrin
MGNVVTDYTPTVEQARDAYVRAMRNAFIASEGEHKEEFDRMLAGVRADTLDEAAGWIGVSDFFSRMNNEDRVLVMQWLRDRATLIRTNGETVAGSKDV